MLVIMKADNEGYKVMETVIEMVHITGLLMILTMTAIMKVQ